MRRKILLHTCCAPCAIHPLAILRDLGFHVTAYFYNPNIHPYQEFKKRLDALILYCDANDLPLVIDGHYQMAEFLRAVVFKEQIRCTICQYLRINKTQEYAKSNGFDLFTTSLLYSRYQNHNEIRDQCEALSKQSEVSFYYKDFREGWRDGIDASLALGLYRQPYCGCIFSEQERYDKTFKSKRNKPHVENDRPSNE